MGAITPPRYPSSGHLPADHLRPPFTSRTEAIPVPIPPQRSEQPRSSSTRSKFVRLLLVAVAAALIGTSIAIDPEGLTVVPILFVLVVPFEKLFPRHRQKLRRPQVGTDIGYALAGPLMTGIGIAAAVVVAFISLAWLPGLAVRPLVGMIPSPLLPFVGIALFDLAIYWTHRWYHEIPILWRFHAIHHSPEHMDWISGFRNHPFDGTLIAPAFIFLLAAGFDAEFTGVLAVVQIVLGIFLHANVRWRLRPLHRIVITPEFHHWHHANEPGAINSNYSVFLPAWDQIFGTYFMPRNRRPQVYGVTEHIPAGMAAQLWHPLRGMGNPLRAVRHPIRAVKATARFIRTLLGDMKRSAQRPRRRSAEDLGPDFPNGVPVPTSQSQPRVDQAELRPPPPPVDPAVLRSLPPPMSPPGPLSIPPLIPDPRMAGPTPTPTSIAIPPAGGQWTIRTTPLPITEVMPNPGLPPTYGDRTVEWPPSTSMAEIMGWDR